MTLVLLGLGFVGLFELLLWLPALWRWRKIIAKSLFVCLVLNTVSLLSLSINVWVLLLAVICLYRAVNLSRLIYGRTQADYLFHTGRQTSMWLISGQLAILSIAGFQYYAQVDRLTWWYILAVAQLVIALAILFATLRQIRTTRSPLITQEYHDDELPSLTVAIPARNETTDLAECLASLLKCHYPKLEILVLDDCSQDKRTSEIIRGLAHDGVRFIAGATPPDHWLAKNFAYDQLYKNANGELILFCGVDIRFSPNSLKTIVKTLLQKNKTMLCVMPRNVLADQHGLLSSVVQSCRYAWEMALPRRLFERPPVLSSCWVIQRSALYSVSGFTAYKQSIMPERHLAHQCAKTAQGYSFLCSNDVMGISSQKSFPEQLATGIRTRYPQLHRRLELVLLVGVAEFILLVWPFIILVAALITGAWVLATINLIACVLLTQFYARITNLTYQKFLLRGFLLLPFAAIYDIALLNYSMWQYEFKEVIWKGRNICMPVMRVYPHLPPLNPRSVTARKIPAQDLE